jgi:hypothetical protein
VATFQWLSVSQSGLDAGLGDVQVVVVDGKRVPVYLQPMVKRNHTLPEIRSVAERKIEDAIEAGGPPSRVHITAADFTPPPSSPGAKKSG